MKRTMEKLSVLSLSLMLVSTYSVSSALPAMLEHFTQRSRTEVEQLISITSFAIMIVIVLNTWLSKFLSQRLSITLGILLLAVAGSTPMFIQTYEVVFAARVLLGIGIGLVNAHAINMINERYDGEERARMLGFRTSAEVLGNAVLTLIAGQLLAFGWTKAFAIYLAGLPILVLYLMFVPDGKQNGSTRAVSGSERGAQSEAADAKVRKAARSSAKDYLPMFLFNICMGILLICINSSNTMRIPALVLERGLGTDADSSVVLSLMLVTGILSGICFGQLVKWFGDKIMAAGMLFFGAGMAIIAVSNHMVVLAVGAMIAGFANNVLVTVLFHRVASRMPQDIMPLGTTSALIGCNSGAFLSPYVLTLIGLFGEKMSTSFIFYAVLVLVIGVILCFVPEKRRQGKNA